MKIKIDLEPYILQMEIPSIFVWKNMDQETKKMFWYGFNILKGVGVEKWYWKTLLRKYLDNTLESRNR